MITCAWIDTSSADTGSSATMKLRLDRERPGDADALPLAAGELVREAVGMLGREADQPQQLARCAGCAPRPGCRPCVSQRLGQHVADAHARVEAGVRVLEDDLHLGAGTAACARRRQAARGPTPSKSTAPAVGSTSA